MQIVSLECPLSLINLMILLSYILSFLETVNEEYRK